METYNANVRIQKLPRPVDEILNRVAAQRNVNKWEIIREALVEYAERHEFEVKD